MAGKDELQQLKARITALEHEIAALKSSKGSVKSLTRQQNEEEIMKADRLLARTFGPAGRVGRHGEPARIPATRPKRVVFLRPGHRQPDAHPPKIDHPRVTNEHRARAKPTSASNVPFKK
jgi:hypothetical protein